MCANGWDIESVDKFVCADVVNELNVSHLVRIEKSAFVSLSTIRKCKYLNKNIKIVVFPTSAISVIGVLHGKWPLNRKLQVLIDSCSALIEVSWSKKATNEELGRYPY